MPRQLLSHRFVLVVLVMIAAIVASSVIHASPLPQQDQASPSPAAPQQHEQAQQHYPVVAPSLPPQYRQPSPQYMRAPMPPAQSECTRNGQPMPCPPVPPVCTRNGQPMACPPAQSAPPVKNGGGKKGLDGLLGGGALSTAVGGIVGPVLDIAGQAAGVVQDVAAVVPIVGPVVDAAVGAAAGGINIVGGVVDVGRQVGI